MRDALKKQYAGEGEGGKPPPDVAVPRPSMDERLQRLREEWQHFKSAEAMAKLLERIVVQAGEDPADARWAAALTAVDAALKPLEVVGK